MRLLTTGVLIVIFCLSIKAQPHLEVYPSELEFTDIFHRLQNAYFINSGNQPLSNIREAIQQHVESLRSHGQEIPQREHMVHVEELSVGFPS